MSLAVLLFLFFPATMRVMRIPVFEYRSSKTRDCMLAVFRVVLIARHAVV